MAELYWVGENLDCISFDSLPADYAVRTCKGTCREGVALIKSGRDLMSQQPMGPQELKRFLAEQVQDKTDKRVLVEGLLKPDRPDYEIPLEIRCHTFGDEIALLMVVATKSRDEGNRMYCYPDWTPTEDCMHVNAQDTHATFRPDPPNCLDDILEAGKCIGRFLKAYARIDFLVTDRGHMLTEITLVPNRGWGFTPYANEYLADRWQAHFPNGI